MCACEGGLWPRASMFERKALVFRFSELAMAAMQLYSSISNQPNYDIWIAEPEEHEFEIEDIVGKGYNEDAEYQHYSC